MNLFALTSLIMSIVSFALALLIFYYSRSKLHKLWSGFNFSLGIYGLGMFLVGISEAYQDAFFYWKVAFLGVANIGMFFYLVVDEFTGLKNKKVSFFVIFHGLLFSILSVSTNWIVHSLKFMFGQFYFTIAGTGWNVFFSIWILIVVYAFYQLFKYIKRQKGLRGIQAKYLLYAMMLGFISGASTSLLAWGVPIYPAWHFFICIYAAICTYAIFRYHLMDIKVAFSRLGIFIFVYAFVLGIPFLFGYKYNMWQLATWSMLVLATAGPFTYLFLQKKVEERILQDERRIQDLLKSASMGFQRIRKLDELLEVLIDILTSSLRLTNAGVYLQEDEKYVLKKSKFAYSNHVIIDGNDPLIERLAQEKSPIIFDEVKLLLEGHLNDEDLREVVKQMDELSAQVIVPISSQNFLLGFAVIGKRKEEGIYSKDMINALSLVADYAGLAIEIAIYVKELNKTLTEMFQDSKQKSMGTMAGGVAHQVNNVLNAISVAVGMIRTFKGDKMFSELSEKIEAKIMEYLDQIEIEAKRGAKIADAILGYSKGKIEARVINFADVVEAGLKIFYIENPLKRNIVHDYPAELLIWMDFSMLQDIIRTALNNSVDAIAAKESEIQSGKITEEGFEPRLVIHAEPLKKDALIILEDNGIGMTQDELDHKIFTPFYTTKGAKKGTGLGIPMMRQLIEQCGGTIRYESEYEKWTKVIITIPLATEEQIKKDQEN